MIEFTSGPLFTVQIAIQRPFERVSFSQQFLVASGLIIAAGMFAIGAWLGRQIEQTAVNRTAMISSVYVESILAAELHEWSKTGILNGRTHSVLDRIFVDGPMARNVVRFKLWDSQGRILYSSDHMQDGDSYPIAGRLAEAFLGRMQANISNLSGPDNLLEREHWSRLLEVYVPVRMGSGLEIRAVVEFYHSMGNLDREILEAQHQSWQLVVLGGMVIYGLLFGLVRRASNTIVDQQGDLRKQLSHLRFTLEDNLEMRARLHQAGAKLTALNEQALRRTAADLHDGPAQHLAYALLRFDDLMRSCGCCVSSTAGRDLERIHGALNDALGELRSIAGGLGTPGIDRLDLSDTLRRAVRDVERKFPDGVSASIDCDLGDAALAIKITAYRMSQEAMTNAARYAPGHPARIRAWREEDCLLIEIEDDGPGFNPLAERSGRFGLDFMRERVRLVGGQFALDSGTDRGTRVCARIPLTEEGQQAND